LTSEDQAIEIRRNFDMPMKPSPSARCVIQLWLRTLSLGALLTTAILPAYGGTDMNLCPTSKGLWCVPRAKATPSKTTWSATHNPFTVTGTIAVTSKKTAFCPDPPCLHGGLVVLKITRQGGATFNRCVPVQPMDIGQINGNNYQPFSISVLDDVTPHWTPGSYAVAIGSEKYRWLATDPLPTNPCAGGLLFAAKNKVKVQPGTQERLHFALTNRSGRDLRNVVIRLDVTPQRHGAVERAEGALTVKLRKNETRKLTIDFAVPEFRRHAQYEATLQAKAYEKRTVEASGVARIALVRASHHWHGIHGS
jgi:hypothetical protein